MLNRFERLEKPRLYSHGFSPTIWRIFGKIGNKFFKSYPPKKVNSSQKNLLNLGSGGISLNDFINADFYRLHKMWSRDRADWMLDITKPMKCHDNYWDGVIIEHTNEHILYSDNYNMLDLVKNLKIPMKKVAIELNQEIINKKNISKIILKENDKIEIVHFIGGG